MPVFAHYKTMLTNKVRPPAHLYPRPARHGGIHATPGVFRTLSVALSCAVLLAGCAGGKNNSAMELIQHQQEQQAMLRQHEVDTMRKNAPSEPKVMLALIRESQQQQRYFASLAYIDAYTRQFGDSAELASLRANALRMTGQEDQAQTAYRALLNTDEAASGWHGLGLLAASAGNFTQAASDLAKATAQQPTNAEYLNDLGFARIQSGDLAGARLPLGQAAELDPDNGKVLANLALLLLLQGEEGQAQTVMDKAQLPPPVQAQVHQLASAWRANSHAERDAPATIAADTSDAMDQATPTVTAATPVAASNTPLARPIVTAASAAPSTEPTASSPIGFHQTPLTGGFSQSPLIR